jgi:hypothetical protein
MGSHSVFLAFYKVDQQWDTGEAWQTRMSRVLMGRYVHVDVMFADGMTTSILNNGSVFFEQRRLSNPKKKMLAINVTPKQEAAMRAFALQCARLKVPFNTAGFYRCALPVVWRKCTNDRFFCSEYAMRLLQYAGHFVTDEPGRCHPTKLYRMLLPFAVATANPMTVGTAKLSTSTLNSNSKPPPLRTKQWVHFGPSKKHAYAQLNSL